MTVLLDPRLLAAPGRPDAGLSSAPEFWGRVVEWAEDRRARLGEESRQLVCEAYGKYGYPDQDLALEVPALRREYQRALATLLARVERHSSEPAECLLRPHYDGSDEQELALKFDLTGTADSDVVALGTASEHWAFDCETLTVSPGPPTELALCTEPRSELPCERKAWLASYYASKRLHIVGGQIDRTIVRRVADELGIGEKNIDWIPCEKAKPPRDLDRRWGGLVAGRDITVCITGRVGHATSAKAAAVAGGRGAVHLQVESGRDILRELKALAGRT